MSSGRGDFSDLLWTDSSSTKKSTNVTLGAALGQTRTASAQSNSRPFDAFNAIASTGGSKPSYGYTASPMSGVSRTASPAISSESALAGTSSRGDAFGDLLSSTGGSSSSSANLSIAQRQARLAQAALETEKKRAQEAKQHGAFWDRFESDVGTARSPASHSSSAVNSPKPPYASSPPLLAPTLLTPVSRPTSAARTHPAKQPSPVASADIWGDFDSLSVSSPARKPSPSPSLGPATTSLISPTDEADDDFLGFGDFQKPSAAVNGSGRVSRSDTPGDFDFGDREDYASGGLLGDDENSDGGDDILGALSQPVRPASRQTRQVRELYCSNPLPVV